MDKVTHASLTQFRMDIIESRNMPKNNSLLLLQRCVFVHSGAVSLVKIVTMLGEQKFNGYL